MQCEITFRGREREEKNLQDMREMDEWGERAPVKNEGLKTEERLKRNQSEQLEKGRNQMKEYRPASIRRVRVCVCVSVESTGRHQATETLQKNMMARDDRVLRTVCNERRRRSLDLSITLMFAF